jgi:hydroxymethylpyrimidine pyrophosphatase-like HAD family hydrolase
MKFIKKPIFSCSCLESVDIEQLIVKMFNNKIQKAYLYYPDEKAILKKLKEKIPVCKAGGGLVYNKKGEVFFIKEMENGICRKVEKIKAKNGRLLLCEKWKKKRVSITDWKLVKKLQKTYHIFQRNGKYKLKVTHWFEMKTDFDGKLIPQAEEGIEKVAWLNPEQIKKP